MLKCDDCPCPCPYVKSAVVSYVFAKAEMPILDANNSLTLKSEIVGQIHPKNPE